MDADKQRVLGGKPQLFDNNLFALQALDVFSQIAKIQFDTAEDFWIQLHDLPIQCMNRFYGNLIGKSIGKVHNINVEEDDMGWGQALRVHVEIKISKPLACGRLLNFKGGSLCIPLKYEKLPCFCFTCG